MKNQLLTFLLGGFVFISFAMTTTDIVTFKPSKPKNVVVFYDNYGEESVAEKIKTYIKGGYIVKSVAGTSQYGMSWVVVMEKY